VREDDALTEVRQERALYCYASGHEGAWEAICLDLDTAAQGRSFEEVSSLLREAVSLYLETVGELPEDERSAFLNRSVPFRTRLRFAIEAFWSALRARGNGELKHQFTMAMPTPA
jgi:predicted RNase H-like HicB family nuclease